MRLSYFGVFLCVILSVVVFETNGEPVTEDPECLVDLNCPASLVCLGGTCQQPCTLCGNNTDCHILGKTPLCLCKPCFTGNPLSGCTLSCKEECKVDDDCVSEKSCVEGLCKSPCMDTCGDHTECGVKNHHAICTCKSNHTWYNDTSCIPIESPPECHKNADCEVSENCQDGKCVDACAGVCGLNAVCRSTNHYPACACSPGYTGDPFTGCKPKCYTVGGSDKNKSYLLVTQTKTRAEAFLDCKSRGMSLVSITSFEEQVAVKEFVTLRNFDLSDIWTSGIWTRGGVVWARPYSSGSTIAYTSWRPEDLSYSYGSCIFLAFNRGYNWNTWKCDGFTSAFLCEEHCS